MKEMDFDTLYTPEEVVERLRLRNSAWIYQRIHSKTLPFPCVRVGRQLRFPASGLNEFISKQLRATK